MAILTFSFIYSNTISRGKTEEREKWHKTCSTKDIGCMQKGANLDAWYICLQFWRAENIFGVNKKPPHSHFFSKLPKKEKGEKQIIQI